MIPVYAHVFKTPVTADDLALWVAAVVANGGSVSAGRQTIVGNLIAGMKTDGTWTKVDRLWLQDTENTASSLTDIKARALATAVSSPTFTANQGYRGTGSAYIDSNLANNFGTGNYQHGSACHFAWNNTAGSDTGPIVGTGLTTRVSEIFPAYTDGNCYASIHSGTWDVAFTHSGAAGLYLVNRTASNSMTLDLNGTQIGSGTLASTSLTSHHFTAMAGSSGLQYATAFRQMSIWGFGGGLSSGERVALYNRLNTYRAAVTGGGHVFQSDVFQNNVFQV